MYRIATFVNSAVMQLLKNMKPCRFTNNNDIETAEFAVVAKCNIVT